MKRSSHLMLGLGFAFLFILNAGPEAPSCVPNPDAVPCSSDADCLGVPHTDCQGNFACVEGFCKWECGTNPAECNSNSDCAVGQYCAFALRAPDGPGNTKMTGKCKPNPDGKCVKDADCAKGEACVLGICPMCVGCPCFGECKPSGPAKCEQDSDCKSGQYCGFGSVCKPIPQGQCISDSDCADGESCSKDVCPECFTTPCPCLGQCKPSGPAKCEQDSDCKSGQYCNSDGLCKNYGCIKEGGSGVVYPWAAKCCADLKSISCGKPDANGQCGQCAGAFFCTKCGDGQCKAPENACNCPDDCADNQKCKLDDECPAGQYCGFNSVCKPIPQGQCISDSDCADGESCSKGVCPECFTTPCPCLGECKPTQDGCKSDKDCKDGEYCMYPDGQCEGIGQCAKRSQYCYMLFLPVCGCDGKDYTNACFAGSAGTSVAYKGQCGNDCTSDADCPKAQYCDGQVVCPDCVYATPPCKVPCTFKGECVDIPLTDAGR